MNDNSVFLTAEIGINHNGDVEIAKKLIDNAVKCGWDAVKFQTRTLEKVIPKGMWYKRKDTPWGELDYIDYKRRLELRKEDYDIIDAYCADKGIVWYSSAWDVDSQLFLRRYDMPYNKIASPMLIYTPLLHTVAEEGKKTFISTALSEWKDVDRAVEIFNEYDCPFVIMHCVGLYPAPNNTLNLSLIPKIRERYSCEVGYSCHNTGVLAPAIGVSLGARYIEKHITLDRSMWGSDQPASLEPRGMELVRKYCDSVLEMLGNGNKIVTPEEKIIADKLRYWQ